MRAGRLLRRGGDAGDMRAGEKGRGDKTGVREGARGQDGRERRRAGAKMCGLVLTACHAAYTGMEVLRGQDRFAGRTDLRVRGPVPNGRPQNL